MLRLLVALGLALALPVTAHGACPEPTAHAAATSSASVVPEAVRARLTEVRRLAATGACTAAAAASTSAYDALAGQPRRHLDTLHAIYADTVHLQLAAHHRRHPQSALAATSSPPATDAAPLCAADVLTVRHRARVRALGRATPAFEATIAGVRSELHARLAGARCPELVALAAEAVVPATPVTGFRSDLLLWPGQLAATTPEPRRPGPAPGRRWQAASRGGVALMAIGLMTLGGGIAAGAIEGVPRHGALQGGLLVAGTALFVGGFPLLIVGDQKARAALAVGPGGASLKF